MNKAVYSLVLVWAIYSFGLSLYIYNGWHNCSALEERFFRTAQRSQKTQLKMGSPIPHDIFFKKIAFLGHFKRLLRLASPVTIFPTLSPLQKMEKFFKNSSPEVTNHRSSYHMKKVFVSISDLKNILSYLEQVQFGYDTPLYAPNPYKITFLTLTPLLVDQHCKLPIYECELKYQAIR